MWPPERSSPRRHSPSWSGSGSPSWAVGAGLEAILHLALVVAGGAVTTGLVALVVLPAVAVRYGERLEAVEDLSFDDEARLGLRGVGAHA